MSLPDLAWQIAYGRLAWAIVLAAVLVGLWPAARRLPRAAFAAILAAVALSVALPGAASPAYHLGLAFQYPSGLLVGLCLLGLHARWQGRAAAPSLPGPMAAAIAIGGLALYLDAIGLLSQGYYYAGYGPLGAPLVALAGTAWCALAIACGRSSRQHLVLLGALLLFALLRLPSGNLWDAVLDPLLWGWALAALVRRAVRYVRQRARQGVVSDPSAGLEPELPALQAAASAESISISKE